jgi:2,4-dichlorophenol 6-monooxygenase
VRDGVRCSTLDLVASDVFTLVTTERVPAWEDAAAAATDLPLRTTVLGEANLEDPARWIEESGIGHAGALLVRPDQHVAWRAASVPADAATALRTAITRLADGEIGHIPTEDPHA